MGFDSPKYGINHRYTIYITVSYCIYYYEIDGLSIKNGTYLL